MNQKKIVWSVLFVLLCCITPIQAKVQGFKEVSKKRYGEDIWHTYQHAQSGLEVIWIENEDVNKAFTIGVKTPTIDDTGVNHIIEHTLFTGSNQYPSPSVFFDASEAYPSTYMNALTSGDMTIFPFSTPYLPCYNALRDIYLDAVFAPNLLNQPYGFYEEGFHSVPEEGRCGGVVYNEMKGAYSSIDRAVYRTIRRAIYKESHYAYDSGGEPNAIPTLTYEQFVDTYKRYYYPGNMKIIIYGDLPIKETLQSILPYVEGKERQVGVDLSVSQINPMQNESYEVLPTQDKACIVKTFVLENPVTVEALQQLDLWMSAYMMSPQTYFQNELGQLGMHVKWLKDDDVPYPIYTLVVTDVPINQVDEYSKKIDSILEELPQKIRKNVFLEQDILKEAKWISAKQENSNNKGVTIAQSILDGWAHDRAENQYYLLKENLEKMDSMNQSISRLLFEDAKRYTFNLLPGRYELANPQELSPIGEAKWTEIYKEIQKWQNQEGDLQPVALDQLVIEPKVIPSITKQNQYWEMESRVETKLARSTLYLNTSHIEQKDLFYLYLYSYLFEESAKDITPFSGSILTQCTAYPLKDGYWPCFKLTITTTADEREHGVLFNQARQYLNSRPDAWYRQKLIELTLGMKGSSKSNALSTLSQLALGSQDERGAYLYQQGYPFYCFCQNLLQVKHNTWIQHIKQMDEALYHKGGTILATAVPKKGENVYAKSWKSILESFPNQPNLKANYQFEIPEGTYIIYNEADVDFCYKNLFSPEGIDGSDYLLAAYLTKNYFNPKIRVKMGAYGAGCQVYDLQTIGIYTYRDPDYRSSLPIIEESICYLKQEIKEKDLNLSKAEAMSKVHGQYKLLGTPLEQSGIMEHLILWGKSPKEIIKLQKEIILSTPQSIANKSETYEKTVNSGKTAIMTKKGYTAKQNFTIYKY
ncbi:MAG: insulinase family protein [Cellulosilyticum sp.]|nr:insulinase family protein [Cellulosilyticum sp.]